jgi:hypothetical protein
MLLKSGGNPVCNMPGGKNFPSLKALANSRLLLAIAGDFLQ